MTQRKDVYIDLSELSFETFSQLAYYRPTSSNVNADPEKYDALMATICKPIQKDLECCKVAPMRWYEEGIALIILTFGVPGSVFSLPVLIALIGWLTGSILRAFALSVVFFLPLSFLPAPFYESSLTSWISFQILRYFSFKVIYQEKLQAHKPRILCAPPHGVFPFGNIVTMIAFPSVMGFSFRGLASSMALRAPIFRQLLCTVGTVDASKETALKLLNRNVTLGISTGGVAEVFEANSPSGDEVVVLKNRKGMIKLAIQTGADIMPCYLFGNTHLYDLYTGGSLGHNLLRRLSRQLGFALIVFWGRWFLPIPYRIPILGVMGDAIHVEKKDQPSQEDIDRIHEILLRDMQALFDEYKGLYGWENKRLVIE
jgi:hypothetical protein